MTIRVARSRGERTTFAVTVPASAVPGAVRRNRLRRRISEQLRLLVKSRRLSVPATVVVVGRNEAMTAAEIRDVLVMLLMKSGILQQ